MSCGTFGHLIQLCNQLQGRKELAIKCSTTYGLGLNTHELGLAKFSPACPVVADHVMINKIRFAAP